MSKRKTIRLHTYESILKITQNVFESFGQIYKNNSLQHAGVDLRVLNLKNRLQLHANKEIFKKYLHKNIPCFFFYL